MTLAAFCEQLCFKFLSNTIVGKFWLLSDYLKKSRKCKKSEEILNTRQSNMMTSMNANANDVECTAWA